MLRKAGQNSPSYDVKRYETMLDSLHKQLEEKEKRICELEDFIVEQDEVVTLTFNITVMILLLSRLLVNLTKHYKGTTTTFRHN